MSSGPEKGTGMFFRSKARVTGFAAAFVLFCLLISAAAALAAETAKNPRHFLWSVKGKRATVYLLGSVHILKKDSYPLPDTIETIFDCCGKIVFETDLDGMKRPKMQNMMMKLGMYPAGQTLSGNVSEETYTLLTEKLRASGIPVERFGQFRPWFAAINLASLELERMGFDASIGVDRHFFDRAHKQGKTILSLESNEFQINLFARLSRQQQEFLLNQTLKEIDIIEEQFQDMIAAWRTGDDERFNAIVSKSFSEYPDIYNRLFTRRNKTWISEIRKLMNQEGSALVIVGAGHLVGRDSVIELLKKRGYRVDQL